MKKKTPLSPLSFRFFVAPGRLSVQGLGGGDLFNGRFSFLFSLSSPRVLLQPKPVKDSASCWWRQLLTNLYYLLKFLNVQARACKSSKRLWGRWQGGPRGRDADDAERRFIPASPFSSLLKAPGSWSRRYLEVPRL